MTNDLKWLISSDQQIPYQDDKALSLWWQVMDYVKPHVIDYLGDTSDQMCFSRFNEGTTTEFVKTIPADTKLPDFSNFVFEQERETKEFYEFTRKKRKNAEIFVALGNHDIRAENYVDRKLPEILDQVTPEKLWGFDKLGIDYIHYNDIPRHRYGDIYVHHGIAAAAESGASVKSDIDKLGVSLIRGHSHRMAAYYKTYELRNETVRGYEIGHMCKVDSPGFKYSQIHNWQQGFAFAIISGNNVHVQLVEITPDYECMVGGKVFKA